MTLTIIPTYRDHYFLKVSTLCGLNSPQTTSRTSRSDCGTRVRTATRSGEALVIREDRVALAEMGLINRPIGHTDQRVIIDQRALSVTEQYEFAQRLH